MRTLVDTCVLSEARRPRGAPKVRKHLGSLDDRDLYLSVVTIGELVRGVTRLEPGSRRDELEAWLRQIEEHHEPRILGVDRRTARIWGELTARAQQQGVTVPAADGLIAATALRHDLAVMTRNTRHFAATGARLSDPWS